MPKQSKRYREAVKKQPKDPVPLAQAVEALKKFDGTKFDQSV
ncbi:MAG: 50S ribosomal protein L1, partial [Planctomycetota bacterium]